MEWLNIFCRRTRAVTLVSSLRFQCAFLWMPRKNARRARPIFFPKCLLLVSVLFVWCFNWLSVYIRITYSANMCSSDISVLVLKCSLQFLWPNILPLQSLLHWNREPRPGRQCAYLWSQIEYGKAPDLCQHWHHLEAEDSRREHGVSWFNVDYQHSIFNPCSISNSRIHVDPAESINSKLVPVRPVAMTAGAISLKAEQVLQLM